MADIEIEVIKEAIAYSLGEFYQNDSLLFSYKNEDKAVSERCIVFRIGWYMQSYIAGNEVLRDYNLDSEYNRCFDHPKSMYRQTSDGIKEKIGNAIPDLIIHKRKSNKYNCAIFEFKKAGSYSYQEKENDIKKLLYFTDSKNEYKFSYGFWIILYKNKKADVHIFKEGQEKSHMCYIWQPNLA